MVSKGVKSCKNLYFNRWVFISCLKSIFQCCHHTYADHTRKKNCEGNPWCLYGFGEKKEGVWKNPDVILDVLCENITKTRSVAQPCGLHNAGATCYLSVILQVERIIKIDEYSLLPPFYVDYLS